MTQAYLNAIGTAVPANDVHEAFLQIVPDLLAPRDRRVFSRMARRSGIRHRHSTLVPALTQERHDADGFYRPAAFPATSARMRRFEAEAPDLADAALSDLAERLGRDWRPGITHVIVATCTGFYAPGLDSEVIARHGLQSDVERTTVGFMGCNAAVNAWKLARHVVRSDPSARVLVLNVELCTLHLQERMPLQTALMFMLFADGAAASLVSAEPRGLALEAFCALPTAGAKTLRLAMDADPVALDPQPQRQPGRQAREERAQGDRQVAQAGPPAITDPERMTETELALLQNLGQRRDALEVRERALQQREALLEVAEQRLQEKMTELETLRGQIQDLIVAVDEQEQEHLLGLVRIYEAMRPGDAAAIFNGLDVEITISVLQLMREQKSAPILAGMNPEKARQVTAELAVQRQLPELPE